MATVLAQPDADVDATAISALRSELEANSELAETERAELVATLDRAAEAIERAARETAETQRLQAAIDSGDSRVADYQRRVRDIEGAPQTLQRRLGRSPGLDAIEAEIGIVEAQRNNWAAERKDALQETANMAANETRLRDRLSEVTAQLEGSGDKSDAAAADNNSLGNRIHRLARAAQATALTQEQSRIQLQLRGAPTLNKLRSARVAWLDAAIAEADSLLTELRDTAAAGRKSAATQRSAETRRLLGTLSEVAPALQKLADENLSLVTTQQELAGQIETQRSNLASTREARERIQEEATLTRRRLAVAGLKSELGEIMLSRLASLPDPRILESTSRQRNDRIAEVSTAIIDTEQQRRALSDRSQFLQQRLNPDREWSVRERRVAEQLYEQQRELLLENLEAENTLLRLLIDSNQASEELVTTIGQYRDFLTGNLLWTRNYNYAKPESLIHQLGVLARLGVSTHVLAALPELPTRPSLILLTLLLLLLISRRRAIRNQLADILGRPIRPRDERTSTIFRALVLTVLFTLPLALFLEVLARAASILGETEPSLRSVSAALHASALVLWFLRFLQVISQRQGLGRRLLKWNAARVDALRSGIGWIVPTLTLATASAALGLRLSPTESGGPLGAIGSLLFAGVICINAVQALKTGQFQGERIPLLALRGSALISAAIAIMIVGGQLFAAHVYLRALVTSIAVVIITLLTINILQRCLLIFRGELQRKARDEQRSRETDAEVVKAEDAEFVDVDMETFASLSAAYEQLLGLARILTIGTSLWWIWSPALPALTILDSVTLWSTADATLPDGELRQITLATLLLVLIVIGVTTLVTKHLPPLVNVLLLEWGKVSAGGRYATGMLMQYVIIGTGGSIALSQLGFEWSKVQWLVAALGVGIGFGLQEIVANFISGLIVLFERPIRPGDIINAGGTDGTVTRINPRATVIETFEGKEVMIPNKELITGTVTNWSLSSSRLRIVVPVGIAYGSDVGLAMRLLVAEAKANPEVLGDPEPYVTFEDFGDNALVLWLRCYALKDYLLIATQLRLGIYERFTEAGIEISFPQRDVHLDASAPIPIRMVGDASSAD